MKLQLAETLLQQNLLKSGTEITATYRTGSVGNLPVVCKGDFMIDDAVTKEGQLLFRSRDTREGRRWLIAAENVEAIDGMAPERYAAVYGIKANGLKAQQGKRRGRPPKAKTLAA